MIILSIQSDNSSNVTYTKKKKKKYLPKLKFIIIHNYYNQKNIVIIVE